jgi:hypothetical protein
VESRNQLKGCAELAHDVRMVVKHTFLELVEDDEFGVRSVQNARHRSSSEPRKFSDHMVQLDKCDLEHKSAASTQANDTDDDAELMLSDDEEPRPVVQAPPGVWAQAQAQPQQQNFMPVCVAFVPVMQQPVWKKSSRSARRRRARAMNRWFRYNMQDAAEGEEQDDLDAEFDDEWQLPSDDAESPELDAESWPMTNSPSDVNQDKKKA